MSTRIDDLTAADVDLALELDLSAFRPSAIGAGTSDPRAHRRSQLQDELARPWSRLRAARAEGGALVGYALAWHVVDEVHLLNVAVVAGRRRQGIGRALVEDLLAYARAQGAARILLEARASNAPALALY
jgi:[ribosomal protein S18]-alanine N-acetyltransferase